MPIEIEVQGDFSATERFLASIQRGQMFRNLDSFAQRGVEALAAATPTDTGATASSWSYEIECKSCWCGNRVDEYAS